MAFTVLEIRALRVQGSDCLRFWDRAHGLRFAKSFERGIRL